MEIVIGGDLVPTKDNIKYFRSNDIDKLIGEKLQKEWFSSDIRIFNLETPITDFKTPISKNGLNLSVFTDTINGIVGLKPSLVSLANNHIMDQGLEGYKSTINLLNTNSIPQVGSGYNLKKASKPFIIEKIGKKIGIYSCAEHEFTIAEKNKAGANPFDPLKSLDHINDLKYKCDYVIVLYHGGKEHYRYPSPYLQKVCRRMIEKGADLIICQHSHCIGSFENYKDSKIIYGQGNFIFNKKKNEFWKTGLLVKIVIKNNIKIRYIPYKTTNTGIKIFKKKGKVLSDFYNRSKKITDTNFVKERYKDYAKTNVELYLRSISGLGKWFSRIDRIIFNGYLINKLYNKKKLLKLLNVIECEAHRELIIKGLRSKI
ncbi:MAG: CapA family protein [archaeon]